MSDQKTKLDDKISQQLYLKTQMEILALAKGINDLPLIQFIAQINHTETIAPLVDPTLYAKGKDALDAIKKLAQAMVGVQTAYAVVFENATKRFAEIQKEMSNGEIQTPEASSP